MTKHNFMYRPGLCAIAAFAAFGTTPLLAQAADPLAPSVNSTPVVTSAPVVVTPDPVAVPTVDPLAAATIATPVADTKPSATKVIRTATRTPARTSSARTATPARASVPVAAATVAPVAATPVPVTIAAPPIADPIAVPAETAVATAPTAVPAPATDSALPTDALPIGAAGLGALALAGAALAMRRRKRRLAEDEFVTAYDEPAFAAEAPVVAAKPAMAWNTTAAFAPAVVAASSDGDGDVPDNVDPSSHVAAAYRGPTAENPSLSLKTRLKRGAFFDQRERQVAIGDAAPLDMTAGLPDAVIDEMPDAPGEAMPKAPPPLSTGGSYSLRPAPEHA